MTPEPPLPCRFSVPPRAFTRFSGFFLRNFRIPFVPPCFAFLFPFRVSRPGNTQKFTRAACPAENRVRTVVPRPELFPDFPCRAKAVFPSHFLSEAFPPVPFSVFLRPGHFPRIFSPQPVFPASGCRPPVPVFPKFLRSYLFPTLLFPLPPTFRTFRSPLQKRQKTGGIR